MVFLLLFFVIPKVGAVQKKFLYGAHDLYHEANDKKDEIDQLNDAFHLVLRITPWTHQQIIDLQKFFGVENILEASTILDLLLSGKYAGKCEALYKQCEKLYSEDSKNLYDVFVEIIKQNLLPYIPQAVINLPSMLYYELNALLDAGAHPQPHIYTGEEFLWPSLQLYILAGKDYIPSLKLLLEFGAQADFIAHKGVYCTAMDLILWEFWNHGEEIVTILLEGKANPNMLCPENDFPRFLWGKELFHYKRRNELLQSLWGDEFFALIGGDEFLDSLDDHEFLQFLANNQLPRLTFMGYFVGCTPLEIAILSIIEQYYYCLVYDPAKGQYDRSECINECQNIIALLYSKKYGGRVSSKKKLQKKLDGLVNDLAEFYGKPVTHDLIKMIMLYVKDYGSEILENSF
jgi:hypothetical protein